MNPGVDGDSAFDEMGGATTPNLDTIQYNSKIVGVTFEGRQEIIAMLSGDEPLRVRREPENEYDPKAVAVDVQVAETWQHIGYIAKDKNKDIAATLDAGNEVEIGIASLTGGDKGADGKIKSYGVNIALTYPKVDSKAKDGSKVTNEATTDNSQTLHLGKKQSGGISNDSAVLEKIKSILGVQETKRQYTSRVLGKTIEVVETSGHVTIPGFTSGSKFPSRFFAEFPKEHVLESILNKFFDEDKRAQAKDAIEDMWHINGLASSHFGNSVHAAMENYDTHYKLGDKIKEVKKFKTKDDFIGPNKALNGNPFLKKIVEDFHDLYGGDYVRLSEQFIWHIGKELCGSIDRLKVIDADKKIVRIQDFKTDGNIHKKKAQNSDSPYKKIVSSTLLGYHQLQLSFYAYILKQYGYTVEGLDIYWLNPSKLATGENAWEEFKLEVIDIEGAL